MTQEPESDPPSRADLPSAQGSARAIVMGAVANAAAAEAVVARLVTLGANDGGVDIVVEPIQDDPATEQIEDGVSLRADVSATQAEAAREALRATPAGKGNGGEGGI